MKTITINGVEYSKPSEVRILEYLQKGFLIWLSAGDIFVFDGKKKRKLPRRVMADLTFMSNPIKIEYSDKEDKFYYLINSKS